jgi:tryptophan synthase alpha chain
MNRINQQLQETKDTFHLFFCWISQLNDTVQIIQDLKKNGRYDRNRIAVFCPLADGPTIQESSTQALHNGMTTQVV